MHTSRGIDPIAIVELYRTQQEDIALGADLQLRCEITGNPEPSYYWYQNQFRVFNKDNVKIIDKGTRLRINNVTASDNGVYSCRAENLAGTIDSSKNFLLNVQALNTPHLIEENFTQKLLVMKNAEARLDCPFINATKIEWFANYEKLYNNTRHTVFSNGSLYFPKVRKSDEAGYRCEGLSSLTDIPAQTFTSELFIAYLEDFNVNSFEPRLVPSFPMVVAVHKEFTVKAFPVDGKPEPSFRWLNKNDMPIADQGAIRMEGSNLHFEDPQQIDSGNYTFIVNNTAGEKRQSVWIIVSVPPVIRRGPVTQEVSEGGDVEFTCQVSGTKYPVTTVIWKKDNEYIKLGSSRHYINQETGHLQIAMVNMDDEGEYFCIAQTTGQKLVESYPARLRVKRKLKFNPVPRSSSIELNSDAEVHCNAEAEVNPKVRWIKGTMDHPDLTLSSHIIDADGTLYFRGVKRSDEGPYTCVAVIHNGATQEINKTINIFVVERPRFQRQPFNTTAYEGHSMMLHCVATGVPRPGIFWEKNRIPVINLDKKRFTVYPNGTLLISKVYMEDQGTWTCIANNTAATINAAAYMHVASESEFANQGEGEEEGFDMMRTVIIAVCSAGAYLALVIGLTAYCSYRLLLQRRNRKAILNNEKQNGNLPQEQHELLMKERDRDSGATPGCRSDSDNRSHVSALSSHPSHSSHSASHTQSQNLSQQSQRSVGKTSLDRLQFPRHELQTVGILGKGQYGDIFLGRARNIRPGEIETQVCVKSLLSKEDHHFYEFQREVELYSRLDHNNVIKLLGVCREIEPQFYIAEYCDWGDLKQFLLASRVDNNGRRKIPPLVILQKIGMCNQVALGMEHLSNNRFVHRDLASRNVLLTSRLELKISHMALVRDMYASEYVIMSNQTMLPLRWLSPEAALEADYSTKSDVFAYGVFLWEVLHLADLPHKNKSDDELLKGMRNGDASLEFSEHCPSEMVELAQRCMAESPKDRPSFTEICHTVSELVHVYSQPQYQNPVTEPVGSGSIPALSSYAAHGPHSSYTT
ncbi:inactive tyrosine-protein kinase 7-like isoform X2 [Mya arenaria]|uniref:inactive tyrosine-protein kinase 7-like isoform X2 n=1 Tax=Mya arenaria TaxID=6604 RepID=UPI0022E3A084|nr:inactive tyrosine-protein kinase 7-like isoform X2 [Mya arenaria]